MAQNESPVRIVVIGAGLIGRRHVEHILAEPRCQLAGIVDPDPRARAVAQKAGVGYWDSVRRSRPAYSC